MSTQEMMRSRNFKIAAMVVGVLLVAIVSFAGGLAVGFHKARFSYAWGENYERNFLDRRDMMSDRRGMMESFGYDRFDGRDFRNAYGVSGTIISISGDTIVVKDRDEKENTVVVTDKTLIKWGRETVQFGDLKSEDRVVVVGRPGDNGTINADLIRVFGSN